jgi:hypothetical protein
MNMGETEGQMAERMANEWGEPDLDDDDVWGTIYVKFAGLRGVYTFPTYEMIGDDLGPDCPKHGAVEWPCGDHFHNGLRQIDKRELPPSLRAGGTQRQRFDTIREEAPVSLAKCPKGGELWLIYED